jgi:hypothetical protein
LRDTDTARTGASIRLKPDSPDSALTPHATAVVEADALHEEPRMAYAEPTIFASTIEEPRRSGGLGLWFAAAASLVLGIVIGFASGYRAGQGSPGVAATVENPTMSGSASQGKPFTESSVPDPVRLEPDEIVPAPGAPDPGVPAAPAPRGDAARPTGAVTPPAVGRTLSGPPGAPDKARPTTIEERPQLTGPASLQVLSRPVGAEVIVDGKPVGRTPLSMEMSPGAHEVRLSLPGFKGWATNVDVKPGITTRVSGSLEQ